MRVIDRRLDGGRERGAVSVLVALGLVGILGLMVLAVDLGGMLVMRRRVVNAADAGALAAASSCALQQGLTSADNHASTDPGVPGHIPRQNLDDASLTRDQFAVTPGCDATSGTVTVAYHAQQPLTFAPLLGFGDTGRVNGSATAVWGVASGGGGVTPIELDASQLRDQCGFPDVAEGTECWFWYNNNDQGNAQWGFMNLDKWDVPGAAQCSGAGASDRRHWIDQGYPDVLELNYPNPTYVCLDTGAVSSNWQTLRDQIGKLKLFPVNDPATQVDRDGNICSDVMQLAGSCSADKYNIVGFAQLEVVDVLDGNNPLAIGTGGGSGDCSKNNNFTRNPPNNVYDLDNANCSIANLHYPDDATKLYPMLSKGSTTYQYNVDYTYDAVTHVVTWIRNQNVNAVKVEWEWSTPGSPGKCGIRPSDPNAKCFGAKYMGYTTSGGPPGPGEDFGVRAVQLTG